MKQLTLESLCCAESFGQASLHAAILLLMKNDKKKIKKIKQLTLESPTI